MDENRVNIEIISEEILLSLVKIFELTVKNK